MFVRIKRTKPEQLYVYSTKNKSGGGTSFSPSVVESHDMNNKGKGKANKTSLKGSKCKCQQPIGRISLRPSHRGDGVFPVSTMANH